MTTRVYLPLTFSELADLVGARRIAGPRLGHAVTDALREEWPDGDDEQWEYAAMQAAADDSWQQRGEDEAPRRVVVAADVAFVVPAPDSDELTAVEVEFDVAWKNVAAAHVDTADRDEDPDGDDLAWFATQEIPSLL